MNCRRLKRLATLFLLAASAPNAHQSPAPQTPPKLAFDVASIKEWGPGERPKGAWFAGVQVATGRVYGQCTDLESLLFFAYQLTQSSPIVGMPAWGKVVCGPAFTNTYDFQATMPAETTEDQARQMMQTLLADRFKLAIHWEKKNMPVYALVVARGGPKLKLYDPKDPGPTGRGVYACPAEDRQCHGSVGTETMSDLAGNLGEAAGRPVIDKTRITGTYRIFFQWAGDNSLDSPLPSLPTALREKLGLELKSESGPVDVLVIDHAEKPTPN